ncbi:MFS domain-containing protein [Aphelenchoides besseyi]|nr:MFS domain-containing protein [Aphelenchoides besseyi]
MKERELTLVPTVPLWHWRSYRLFILIFLMLAFATSTSVYMNLGIALVCMVNSTYLNPHKNLHTSDQCPNVAQPESELGYTGTLLWSPMQQGQLFAVFFYACILSMSISGALADHFNAKRLAIGATFFYSILSLVSPLAANFHFYAFLSIRFLMGIAEGFVYPCITKIVASWCPPNERATAASIYTSGHQIASVVSVIISAKLCSFNFLGGWPLIFYFFGICGLFSTICYMIFVTNSPDQNRFISEKERNFLHESLVNEGLTKKHESKRIPWRKIFSSMAVFSIMSCEFSYQYSSAIFANFLPSFFRDVMRFDMEQNGFYTSVPFIVQIVFKILISVMADTLKSKYGFSATTTCKVLQTVATMGAAIVLVAMSSLDCTRPTLAMILIVSFGALFSGEIAGSFTATLFIAPPYTGTLSSLTALFGSIGGIVAPTVFGLINQNGTRHEYANVFYSAAIVNVVAGLVFLVFGSAEMQPWALETTEPKSNVPQLASKSKKGGEAMLSGAAPKKGQKSGTPYKLEANITDHVFLIRSYRSQKLYAMKIEWLNAEKSSKQMIRDVRVLLDVGKHEPRFSRRVPKALNFLIMTLGDMNLNDLRLIVNKNCDFSSDLIYSKASQESTTTSRREAGETSSSCGC